jgi:hypothetical protein
MRRVGPKIGPLGPLSPHAGLLVLFGTLSACSTAGGTQDLSDDAAHPDGGGGPSNANDDIERSREFVRANNSGGPGGNGEGLPGHGVRWVGRVDASNPSAVKFAWSGTGFVATVNGTKISVKVQVEGTTTSAFFFQPVIDGVAGARFQVTGGPPRTVVLASALSAGDHAVELYRETEASHGNAVFYGFVDGILQGAPPGSGRLIEIVGDSISAGFGNLGHEEHSLWDKTCSGSLENESAYRAYGAVMGRELQADVNVIARSGWGMYRGHDGSTSNVLSAIYENTLGMQSTPRWDFARKADVVVIHLGTNDTLQGDPGAAYERAYIAFLRTVRGHYPDAWIFLAMGPMKKVSRWEPAPMDHFRGLSSCVELDRCQSRSDADSPDQHRGGDGRQHDHRRQDPGARPEIDGLRLPSECRRGRDHGRRSSEGHQGEARLVASGGAARASCSDFIGRTSTEAECTSPDTRHPAR